MDKIAIVATIGVVSVSAFVAGYTFIAVFLAVVACTCMFLYPKKSAEVDSTNKAVLITGRIFFLIVVLVR